MGLIDRLRGLLGTARPRRRAGAGVLPPGSYPYFGEDHVEEPPRSTTPITYSLREAMELAEAGAPAAAEEEPEVIDRAGSWQITRSRRVSRTRSRVDPHMSVVRATEVWTRPVNAHRVLKCAGWHTCTRKSSEPSESLRTEATPIGTCALYPPNCMHAQAPRGTANAEAEVVYLTSCAREAADLLMQCMREEATTAASAATAARARGALEPAPATPAPSVGRCSRTHSDEFTLAPLLSECSTLLGRLRGLLADFISEISDDRVVDQGLAALDALQQALLEYSLPRRQVCTGGRLGGRPGGAGRRAIEIHT